MSIVAATGLLLDLTTVLMNGMVQAQQFQAAIAKAQAEGRTDLSAEIEAFRVAAGDSLTRLDTLLSVPQPPATGG